METLRKRQEAELEVARDYNAEVFPVSEQDGEIWSGYIRVMLCVECFRDKAAGLVTLGHVLRTYGECISTQCCGKRWQARERAKRRSEDAVDW